MRQLQKVLRWLRSRQSGPIYRIRRAYMIVRAGGPVRGLPKALARELFRRSDLSPSTLVIQAYTVDPKALHLRLQRVKQRRSKAEVQRIAAISGQRFEQVATGDLRFTSLFPEDWQSSIQVFDPDVLLVDAGSLQPTGAWAYRLAWSLSADRVAERDLRALRARADVRAMPMFLVMPNCTSPTWSSWLASAPYFDAVLVPDHEALNAAMQAPNIHGAILQVGRPSTLAVTIELALSQLLSAE
jgi:hypothetical protein